MNKLTITRTNGNVPKSLAGEDHISGFMAYLSSDDFPEGYEPGSINPVSTIDAAEALGITSDSEVWAVRMLHYQLSEIFRINSGIELYLGLFQKPASDTWDFTEIKSMQNYAGGAIRQLAIWAGDRDIFNEDNIKDIVTIQSVADALDEENAPLSVLYAPKVTSISDVRDFGDQSGQNCCRVSVVIGQEGSSTGAELYEDEDNEAGASVSCIGVVLGLLSSASVHESISWVKQFPTGISVPAFGDGTLYRDLDKSVISSLDSCRYLFPVTHVGQSGSYMNDSHTMDSAISDYAMIESVRTMDKAVRGVRTYVIPELGGNMYVDADSGQLQSYSVSHLETTAGKALEDMEKAGEISGYSVSIDPDQDVLSTSTVEIVMKIVAVGVMRTINVKIGFTTSL